ncbi:membrane fusion protein, multidrug efflux system/membrane fusion protein, multidrug efflux system [Duganella sp. CF517]|uniref:efflux RND transporter periplasmic adaptor subunit n=1 Tax=Duganella sp. CF517 TaxID=1881038 RepID=UPI0008D0CE2F|nr:efflux RND transporter periplasmic adaptor subunit [Duganella sp. CF517]SEN19582.1 membrane fusion protein, multidrug efflux system/membrane fusion protein, multidrug efflux system [Duganella sp. CF517]
MEILAVQSRSRWAKTSFMCGLALTLAACGKGDDGGQHGGGPPPVSVAPVVQREVQEFDEFTARLEAPNTVEIRSRVAGMLTKVHFREGQVVNKGDRLFTIDPRPFAAEAARLEAQLLAAKTQGELNKTELARAERLVSVRGVSQQEIDQLRAALASAQANVKAAEAALVQARLNLEFTNITAPVTGRTSRANITEGNLVSIGDPVLTTVVSSDRVYAYFDASEAIYLKYMRSARDGSRGSSRDTPNEVRLGLANEEGFPHAGKMDFVDNRLNPATASMRGRAVFDNKDGLYTPGLFARLQLVGSGKYTATMVLDRAISTDQTRKVVLVVGKNNIVDQREVKTGALIGAMRAVTGVKPGELVIVDGLLRAMPGAPVTPQQLKVDDKGVPIPAPPPGAPGAPAAPAAAKS